MNGIVFTILFLLIFILNKDNKKLKSKIDAHDELIKELFRIDDTRTLQEAEEE